VFLGFFGSVFKSLDETQSLTESEQIFVGGTEGRLILTENQSVFVYFRIKTLDCLNILQILFSLLYPILNLYSF
jgi:hypothetical protein